MTRLAGAPGPDLSRVLRAGLVRLQRATAVDAAMGGLVAPGQARLVITELYSMRTDAFRGTVVTPGAGVGGQAWRLARPVAVDDYLGSSTISHHYDRQAQAERAFGTFAVPLRVGSSFGALVWGVVWSPQPLGDRVLDAARPVAVRLAHELAVETEVSRRLASLQQQRDDAARSWIPQISALEIREELSSIARSTADADVRDRLAIVCQRLSSADAVEAVPVLTRREHDVLAQIALGLTNEEAAERLMLMPTTVKSYLKSAMRKFGTRNRVETIRAARRSGLLL